MSKHEHTSDEFGKPMSAMTGVHPMDPGAHGYGAASQILINVMDEEARGVTPSSFSVASWKIALTLVIVFALGAGGLYYMVHTHYQQRAMNSLTGPLY